MKDSIQKYLIEEIDYKYENITIQAVFSYKVNPEDIEYKFTLGYISKNTYFYINTFEERYENYNKFIQGLKDKVFNYLGETEDKFKHIFIQDILF